MMPHDASWSKENANLKITRISFKALVSKLSLAATPLFYQAHLHLLVPS